VTLPGCQYIDVEAGAEECCDAPAPYILSEPLGFIDEMAHMDLCEQHAAVYRTDFAERAPHPSTRLRSRGMTADTSGGT
jgi:hypothetical protein